MTELLLRKKCGEYVKSMSEIRSRTAVGTGDLGEMLGKEKSKQGKFSHWKNQSRGKFCEVKIKAGQFFIYKHWCSQVELNLHS